MRDYRNEMEPIKNATHKNLEFDIYRINKYEEWKKIKTVKLIDYRKKFECGGSGGCSIFNLKNGKELELLTVETYDLAMETKDRELIKKFLKRNYITLETLNTIFQISEEESWDFEI